MFFCLNKDCHLVVGQRRGAIYNVKSGKVHSISPAAVSLLTGSEGSSQTMVLSADLLKENELQFLDHLISLGLGSFYYQQPALDQPSTKPVQAQTLDFIWLELTGMCNNRCLHCYADSSPETITELPLNCCEQILREAFAAGARSVQLIGGEPLLYPHWRELALYAKELGFEIIEIFTNATLITEKEIAFIQEHKLQIATTLYSDKAAIHDLITQNPGSFEQTLAAIKSLLAAHVPLRIASILMKQNETEGENIMKLCASLGLPPSPPDVIRPTGRGNDQTIRPNHLTTPPIQPPFFTDPLAFSRNQSYHSCLAGKVAITATGDVIPCIFAREQILGNIHSESLSSILAGEKLQSCWRLTKDKIEKCCGCEYRYACHDCRPLAQATAATPHWLAAPKNCLYNPALGIWEEK
ncbi:MAG: radical SAM protein [Sporomusaceae bacterium]|nr:radical SAM protein [Sporomusaceae bacterium]